MFPALIAGNTIVFKPASDTPHSALRLVELLYEAGLPAGVVNIVFGAGQVVGERLLHHPSVNIISFTGSTESGRHVAIEAAKSLKRVSLEMGGKNAVIVLDDADLDLAVEGILWSAYGTTGQRCTACSRLIVQRSVQDRLLEMLVPRIEQLRLGNGLDEQVDVGPVINARQLEAIHQYTAIGKDEGGLSSALYTQNINLVQRATRDITTGILYINSGTTGAEIQLPFGGTRGTGNGHREAGIAGLDVFTEWKVVYTDYSGRLQKAQIDS